MDENAEYPFPEEYLSDFPKDIDTGTRLLFCLYLKLYFHTRPEERPEPKQIKEVVEELKERGAKPSESFFYGFMAWGASRAKETLDPVTSGMRKSRLLPIQNLITEYETDRPPNVVLLGCLHREKALLEKTIKCMQLTPKQGTPDLVYWSLSGLCRELQSATKTVDNAWSVGSIYLEKGWNVKATTSGWEKWKARGTFLKNVEQARLDYPESEQVLGRLEQILGHLDYPELKIVLDRLEQALGHPEPKQVLDHLEQYCTNLK